MAEVFREPLRGVEGVSTLKLLRILIVRTFPFIRPYLHHGITWFGLQMLANLLVVAATVIVIDVTYNKIFNAEPLEAVQAQMLFFDESYVDTPALTGAQRVEVASRFGIAVFVGAIVLIVLLDASLTGIYYTWIVQQVNQGLRARMVENAEHLSLRQHSHARTGDAIYRVFQDSAAITGVLDTVYLDFVEMTIRLVVAIAVLWLFDPILGLLAVAVTVPIVLLVKWFTPRVQRRSRLARSASSDLTSRIQEVFAAIRIVKANQAEAQALERFDDDSQTSLDRAFRLRMEIVALWGAVMIVFGMAIVASYYLMAGWAVENQETWLAGAFAFVGFGVWNLGAYEAARERSEEYFGYGLGIIMKWTLVQDMVIGLDRAFAFLDMQSAVVEAKDPVAMPRPIDRVQYQDVGFSYEAGKVILEGVNLAARVGTITAIVGATGSGKSTLLSLLLRLYDPDAGTIQINGTALRDLAVDDVRRSVAIALQQNVLFAASVADNIGYAATTDRDRIRAAAEVACAHEFISAMAQGYDTELGERGGKLSAGQRQRISIARAVVRDTPILILDEPTASLDAETEHRLLDNLAAWGKDRIVLLITHRLSTIKNADQIAFLEDGRIKEIGDHAALMAVPDGRYRSFVRAETHGATV